MNPVYRNELFAVRYNNNHSYCRAWILHANDVTNRWQCWDSSWPQADSSLLLLIRRGRQTRPCSLSLRLTVFVLLSLLSLFIFSPPPPLSSNALPHLPTLLTKSSPPLLFLVACSAEGTPHESKCCFSIHRPLRMWLKSKVRCDCLCVCEWLVQSWSSL